jgi:hypothetical protein
LTTPGFAPAADEESTPGRRVDGPLGFIKSIWGVVQYDPTFMRRLNGWLTLVWIVMIPVSIVMGWLSSVAYVSALSLWALVSGHWAAWQAARVEVKQEEEQQDRRRNGRSQADETTRARS